MKEYKEIMQILPNLIQQNKYDISILANASALLYEMLPNINWVGFYLFKKDTLLLGPFQGKIACTQIPLHKGVCGTCASTLTSILVEDVHQFEGHIACDQASQSEICIPVLIHHTLYAVLDVDSPIINRFSIQDQTYLEEIVEILRKELEKTIDLENNNMI